MENIEILIVEDSITQAEELRYILESNDHKVTHAIDAETAIEILKKQVPDIIISDIVMPGMDGFELCRRVKSDERFKKIPFILLTSLSEANDIIKGLESGTNSFITKPYNEEFLLSKIRYLILNFKLRQNQSSKMGLEILFSGKKHLISSDRLQILDLLLSTYENSVIQNKELEKANKELGRTQLELKKINQNLDKIVDERTLELRIKTQQLEKTNHENAELIATKDKLFSIIAHDLLGNFNPLLGYSDLLIQNRDNFSREEIYSMSLVLNNSLNNQFQLLTNLLEWGHIQSKHLHFNPVKLNLFSCICETSNFLKQNIEAKEIVFEIEVENSFEIFADKHLLYTILRNLVSNAIKFSNTDGKILVSAQQKDGYVQVDVKDFGVGIDKINMEKMFNKNGFLSTTGTKNEKGSGLGLILCREFVEVHGGKIWAESMVDSGTTISFTLPIEN